MERVEGAPKQGQPMKSNNVFPGGNCCAADVLLPIDSVLGPCQVQLRPTHLPSFLVRSVHQSCPTPATHAANGPLYSMSQGAETS